MKEELIRFTLNGKLTELTIDPDLTLLWVLRDQFGLTGTKYGCGTGYCGACTIIMNNEAVRSCMLKVGEIPDSRIITIEGLSTNGELHPLQKAFVDSMTKQLQDKGHFEIVTEKDDDVLEIAAMITALAPSASKDADRMAGRSTVYTEGGGSMAVAVAFGDSQTGEVLALVKDARSTSNHWGQNNSVTNMSGVKQVFNSWATQINNALHTVTGKEEPGNP